MFGYGNTGERNGGGGFQEKRDELQEENNLDTFSCGHCIWTKSW